MVLHVCGIGGSQAQYLIEHKTAEEDCSCQGGGIQHVEHIVKASLAL